jgi:hypothetical protein
MYQTAIEHEHEHKHEVLCSSHRRNFRDFRDFRG